MPDNEPYGLSRWRPLSAPGGWIVVPEGGEDVPRVGWGCPPFVHLDHRGALREADSLNDAEQGARLG